MFYGFYNIRYTFGVTGTVGQKYAIWFEVENLLCRSFSRCYGDFAVAQGQLSQNIVFDAGIKYDDVIFALFAPWLDFFEGNILYEVSSYEAGGSLCFFDEFFFVKFIG